MQRTVGPGPVGRTLLKALPPLRGGLVAVLLCLAVLPTPPAARADCTPAFSPDMQRMRDAVGDAMGQPVDCGPAPGTDGDTIQYTTTGMDWLTASTGVPGFTDGEHRWELTPRGLLYWAQPGGAAILLDGLPEGPAVWSTVVRCPVLYTHEVPSTGALRELIVGLRRAGYEPTSFSDVDAGLRGERSIGPGCVVLTFDDALLSQQRNALPVLSEMGVTALFFVLPAFQDGVHAYMQADGIRALYGAGQLVGAHTCNHPSLTQLAPAPMMAELEDCRHIVEGIVGASVRYFAYPNGAVNQEVVSATARAGYRAAFTTRSAVTLDPLQPLLLPRIRYVLGEPVSAILSRMRAAR